jgi:hypothetical protein
LLFNFFDDKKDKLIANKKLARLCSLSFYKLASQNFDKFSALTGGKEKERTILEVLKMTFI